MGAQGAQVEGERILRQQFHIFPMHKGLFPVAQRQFAIGIYQSKAVPLRQPVQAPDKDRTWTVAPWYSALRTGA